MVRLRLRDLKSYCDHRFCVVELYKSISRDIIFLLGFGLEEYLKGKVFLANKRITGPILVFLPFKLKSED